MDILYSIILNKIIRMIIYAIILIVILLYPIFFRLLGLPVKHKFVEEYNFKVNEPTGLKMAVILPSDGPYQEITDIDISWEGDTEIIDYDTARVARISGKLEDNLCIRIKYTAKIKTGRINWDEKIIDKYIQEESGIESTENLIISKANSIVKGKSIDDIREIYNFVNKHIKWPTGDKIGSTGDIQSALTALETGEGVCGEFANLMVALCRAKGIPAKSISGLFIPLLPGLKKPIWNHQAGAHAWVEFYADGQWHFADPSHGGTMNFNSIDGFHLSYGEKDSIKQIYDSSVEWADKDYYLIGAMSNPLKFVVAVSSEDVIIEPAGFLDTKNRYFLFIAAIIVLIITERILIRYHPALSRDSHAIRDI